MKSLQHYLTLVKKDYSFKVKLLSPIKKEQLVLITKAFERYNVVSISKPVKTIFHNNPVDFANVSAGEVYSVVVKTEYPASTYIVKEELKSLLNLTHDYVVVRGENDPLESRQEAEIQNTEINTVVKKKGLFTDALLNHPDYPEVEQPEVLYGDDYNKKLLKGLAQERSNRESNPSLPTTDLIKGLNKDTTKDNDKVINTSLSKGKVKSPTDNVSKVGNVLDKVEITKMVKDANGKSSKLTAKKRGQ